MATDACFNGTMKQKKLNATESDCAFCRESREEEQRNMEQGMPRRKTYRFAHSVGQGGWLFAWKTKEGAEIAHKEALREKLNAIIKQHQLLDPTVKIYHSILFFFFTSKPSVNHNLIVDMVAQNISNLEAWDDEYLFTGAYDLQEAYVRRDLKRFGFDYDEG